uniref:VHL domain-containing protein n=1 Tax=Caenorhabditis japonica TaxID=281687 RepID=A0A8R1HKD4_CAEJA
MESEIEDDGRLFPDVGAQNDDSRPIRVRFFNNCPNTVDVFWLSPQKEPTKYGTLAPRRWLDIQTYKNHPWVARRSSDGCKVMMNKQPIFWPEPMPPNVVVRATCIMKINAQSLREIAERSLIQYQPSFINRHIQNIPRDLQFEVQQLMAVKEEYNEIVCRAIPPPPPRRPQPPRQPQ